mmetsp:Transcript_46868/g.92247  ORF Transcript_46868/g.92247 Transcript_46868/m.92247 type:complete len:214 (-) Transcript_46868:680-1321(-)
MRVHSPDARLSEGAGLGSNPYDGSGLDHVDNIFQSCRFDLVGAVSELQLLSGDTSTLSPGVYQPPGIYEVDVLAGLLHRHAVVVADSVCDQVGDPDPRAAGSVEQEHVLFHRFAESFAAGVQASQHHRRSALYIVVEAAAAVAVLLQQPECVLVGEVFELQQDRLSPPVHTRDDELLDQGVVFRTPLSLLLQTSVHIICKQAFIVGASVQADG